MYTLPVRTAYIDAPMRQYGWRQLQRDMENALSPPAHMLLQSTANW